MEEEMEELYAEGLATHGDWERMDRMATRWLPRARVMHPFPGVRFAATHPR
jgi:hypothetical protein